MPFFLGNAHHWGNGFSWSGGFFWPAFFIPLALWSVMCTGVTLWHAAKRGDIAWFIFFLVVHTAGILELFYLAFIAGIFNQNAAPKKTSRSAKKRS